MVEGQEAIEEAFVKFFKEKWRGQQVQLTGWPDLMAIGEIVGPLADSLTREVSTVEIWEAINDMGTNRTPGLDGITSSFIRKFWNIVGAAVVEAVSEFFQSGEMPAYWKETLVVLIPKVLGAASPEKFRPISLCQTFYKFAAKIIVGRLKGILPLIISREQAAFVPGRSISQHCLLAQEVMNKFQYSASKEGYMALKIDMEQAYDKMEWDTLHGVLEAMKFPPPPRFIGWIMGCIKSLRFSLLINHKQTEWIQANCGFRQECPLSPYLFILCSELLLLALAKEDPKLGLQISLGGPRVSHLLYADDILIFSKASPREAKRIKTILGVYGEWTGQWVNTLKSDMLFSRRMPERRKTKVAKVLGFRKVYELEYLGIKLCLRKLSFSDFSNFFTQVRGKLHGWGTRFLSMAGRAVLLNSSLIPMIMYAMTHSMVPRNVLMEFEKLVRHFFWSGNLEQRSIHYVSWEKLCLPIQSGGLGFHATATWQGPLRGRLAWDVVQNSQSLFSNCFMAKYGSNPWARATRREDSRTWKIIKEGTESLRDLIRWKAATGEEIRVLGDRWICDRSLAT